MLHNIVSGTPTTEISLAPTLILTALPGPFAQVYLKHVFKYVCDETEDEIILRVMKAVNLRCSDEKKGPAGTAQNHNK